MRARTPLLALLSALLLACSGGDGPTEPEPGPSELLLAPGEVGQAEGLSLTFRQVASDSRCPVDVECVWAGDAEVELFAVQGDQARDLTLHTTLDPQQVLVGGVTVRLLELTPTPRSDQAIEPGDYRVRVRLEN